LVAALTVGLLGLALPLPQCQFQAHFGIPSPSCGLTRSFLALARGDVGRSLQFHLFGPVIFMGLISLGLGSAWELYWRRSLLTLYTRWITWPRLCAALAVFLAYYGLRLWVRYGTVDLPWGLEHAALWQGFVAGAQVL
jgi:hypothetical protein